MSPPEKDEPPVNPYASPLAPTFEAPTRPPAGYGSIDFLKLLNQTSEALTDNLGTFLALGMTQSLFIIFLYLCGLLVYVLHVTLELQSETLEQIAPWGVAIYCQIFAAWTITGIVRVSLPMLRCQPYSWHHALTFNLDTLQVCFLWLPSYGIFFAGNALWPLFKDRIETEQYNFGVAVVQYCVGIMFSLAPQFIVDRKMWFGEAILASVLRVGPNFLPLAFGIFCLYLILAFAVPFTLGLGIFLIVPILTTCLSIAYLQATGEKVVKVNVTRPPRDDDTAPRPIIAPPRGFEGDKR